MNSWKMGAGVGVVSTDFLQGSRHIYGMEKEALLRRGARVTLLHDSKTTPKLSSRDSSLKPAWQLTILQILQERHGTGRFYYDKKKILFLNYKLTLNKNCLTCSYSKIYAYKMPKIKLLKKIWLFKIQERFFGTCLVLPFLDEQNNMSNHGCQV